MVQKSICFRAIVMAGVLFIPLTPADAQIISMESRFQRQLDAILGTYEAGVSLDQDTFELVVHNRFQSRFFLLNNEARNPQDEHHGNLSIIRNLYGPVDLITEMRTYTLRNARIRQDFLLGGVQVTPWKDLRIRTQIGFMNDVRGETPDQGLALHVSARSPSLILGDDIVLRPDFSMEYGDISPRQYLTHRYAADMRLSQEFFTLDTRVQAGRSLRESYQSSSFLNVSDNNFVESIQTDTTYFVSSLTVPFTGRWNSRFEVSGLHTVREVNNSKLDENDDAVLFDSRSLRQRVDFTAVIDRATSRYFNQLGVTYTLAVRESQLINTNNLPSDQVRRRTEILRNSNFNQGRFELFTNNRLNFSYRYRLDMFTAASIMRYDTPETNFDDRDEFTFLFRLKNAFDVSEYFTANVSVAGEAYHYVYLFSERSIENNWRRSIRLVPELVWQPSADLLIKQSLFIRANYTVEDYEIAGRPKNDQVSRELVLQSELDYRFASGWNLQFYGSRSELRIGKLFWDTFEETPIDTLITYDTSIQITRQTGRVLLSSGIRYFLKTDFLSRATNAITVTQPDGSITTLSRISTGQQRTVQWGPIVTISMPFSDRNTLYVNGWYQQQFIRERLYITYPEEYRNAFLRAEKRAEKRVFPNIEILVKLRF